GGVCRGHKLDVRGLRGGLYHGIVQFAGFELQAAGTGSDTRAIPNGSGNASRRRHFTSLTEWQLSAAGRSGPVETSTFMWNLFREGAWRGHDFTAAFAGAELHAIEESLVGFRYGVFAVVAHDEAFFMQKFIAPAAKPMKPIDLSVAPLALRNKRKCIGRKTR